MRLTLMLDNFLENWWTDVRDSIMILWPYCLLIEKEKRELIHQLLESSVDRVMDSSDPGYLQLDPMNWKDRRDKEGWHIRIILESLWKSPDEYDTRLRELWLDMDMVDFYYQQQKESNSYYRNWLVYES